MPLTTVRDDPPADLRSAFALGLVAVAVVWASVLGHESAHFGIAQLVYSPTDLAAGRMPTGPHLETVAAGPVFTLLTVAAAALIAPLVRTWRGRLFASIVIGSAASRLLLTAPATLLDRGGNDERTAGLLTGLSPRLLWTCEAIVIFSAVAFVAKQIPTLERRPILQWAMIALVLGWATAIPLGRAIGLPI
jgi:hypothetical protein